MVTVTKISDAGHAARYFQRQVQEERVPQVRDQTDQFMDNPTQTSGGIVAYVANPGEPQGHWFGTGPLGLEPGSAVADEEQLTRLLQGRHALTGQPLTQTVDDKHQAGWEIVYAPAKSVSAVWAIAAPELRTQIEAAHQAAVQEAMQYLDKHAAWTRRGHEGQEREQVHLLGAEYQHSSSRANDPHLHSHLLVANVAQRQDGTWGTIESHPFYEMRKTADALYQSELAHGLQELGFSVQRSASEAIAIEICGVPENITQAWSTRHEQMEVHGQSAEADAAWDRGRPEKGLVDREANFERWRQEAAALGWSRDDLRGLRSEEYGRAPDSHIQWDAAIAGLTKADSTFTQTDLVRELAVHSYGHWDATEVQTRAEEMLEHAGERDNPILALGPDLFTTRSHLATEQIMLRTMADLAAPIDGGRPANPDAIQAAVAAAAVRGQALSDEQQRALETVTGIAQLTTVQGLAGAGKTTLQAAVRQAYEGSGCKVIGVAMSRQAAKELQAGAGIASTSVAAFRVANETSSETEWSLDANTVIVADEASMIDTRALADVVRLANEAGAKLVMIGDERQLPSIGSGGGFAAARDIAGAVGADAQLESVQRQREAWQREATRAFSAGQVLQALQRYDEAGRVHVAPGREVMRSMVQQWAQDREAYPGGTQLMVTSTHGQCAVLNQLAQEARLEQGELGSLVATGMETAKEGLVDLYRGDTIIFRSNSREVGVTNGQTGTVLGSNTSGHVIVQTADTIAAFNPATYTNWHLGYATTTHAAQGQTVDRAYYMVSSRDHREASYVAASRHRVDLHLYINQGLYRAVQVHGERADRVHDAAQVAHDRAARAIEYTARQMEKQDEKHLAREHDRSGRPDEPAHVRACDPQADKAAHEVRDTRSSAHDSHTNQHSLADRR